MKRTYWYVIGIAIIAAAIFVLFQKGTTVSADLVVNGNYNADNVAVAHGAKITVNGALTLDKTLSCADGPLDIVINGNATINGTLLCNRTGNLSGSDIGSGITLVVTGSLTFGKNAQVISNGHVQIVNNEKYLLTSQDQVDALYQETGENSGKGLRVGPFIAGGKITATAPSHMTSFASNDAVSTPEVFFIPTAHAQAPHDNNGNVVDNVVISGHWYIGDGGNPPPGLAIPTPPPGVHHIILNFNFGQGGNVKLQDFYLAGPNGADGKGDEGKNCTAIGENGKDAMRFRADAGNIDINNFTLELGAGGKGGNASTPTNCDPGKATGGAGGQAGNFKMTAEGAITIASMHIIPGRGGGGGSAEAYGKDGDASCPGKKGGDATATGGAGGDNKKELAATGAVDGIGNITVDPVEGGIGGEATAQPGKGGNGNACKCDGGAGGKAAATGGGGGNATVKIAGGSADANGGDGGDADAQGGHGGTGGSCNLTPTGGNGGKGGDANAQGGTGGTGTTNNGTDGTIKNEIGGNGGNGGNGCGPGGGGKGGSGQTPGQDGQPGKKQCPDLKNSNTQKPPEGGTSQTSGGGTTSGGTGTVTGGTGTTSGGTTNGHNATPGTSGSNSGTVKVQAIQYQGKYIPVSELMVMQHSGCSNQPHWHSKPEPGGPVKATDGSTVFDPGPECGFGTVATVPVVQVDVPASQPQ